MKILNKTIKHSNTILSILLISIFMLSCGDDPVVTPEPEEPGTEEPEELADWFSWEPKIADADKELTIYFKASQGSQLFNYQGDVYLYSGVIQEGQWRFHPDKWEDNNPKYKMSRLESNVWKIDLSSTVREWFGAGSTSVKNIGIIARSSDGTKKGLESDYFLNVTGFEPKDAIINSMPSNLKPGINIIDNTTVTFVLFDKDKSGKRKDFAYILGDFNDWTLSNNEKSQMSYDPSEGCWWITINNLSPSTEYTFQYYIGMKGGDAIYIADPYSNKILDPNNDKYISNDTYPDNKKYPFDGVGIVSVFQTQPEVYNWKVTDFQIPSPDNLVIYEMLLRDFTESGDLNGAMEKLDYLESLGVNAIELMPVQEFDGNDSWGYNPAFFFAMDKAYGTDRMYKEFIDECHRRGIAVILDVVYNHATGANPFAKMWWNSSNNKTAANNPFFNVNAPHPYSVFHDFNHNAQVDGNYIVRDFVKRNLQFLLEEYNIDGFRFDLTKGFTQNNSTESTASNYDASRIAILKEYNDAIKAVNPDAYVILEHFADNREETELSNEGMMVWRNMNWAYGQTAMGYSSDSDLSGTYYGTSSRPSNSLVSYMESHDEERLAYKQKQWAEDPLKSSQSARMSQLGTNAAFFFTVPGPKMIWQFGELGYDISIDENGRTGKKPIKWNYQGIADRKQLFNTYSKLIELRMEHEELFNSTATLDWKVTQSFWQQGRFMTLSSFGNAKQVVVVGNFTNSPISASTTFPSTGTWHNYMKSGETLDVTSETISVSVPANSFRIYTSFE